MVKQVESYEKKIKVKQTCEVDYNEINKSSRSRDE